MTQQPAPYQYVDPDAFLTKHQEAMAERQASGYQKSWQPKVGPTGQKVRNEFRIMPPHVHMGGLPIVKIKMHFSLGPNGNVAAPCLEPYAQPCPACEWDESLFQRARAEMDPIRKAQYRDLAFKQRAKLRYGMNVVDLLESFKGVQPYWYGQDVYDFVAACFYDDSNPPRFRDITHPESGRDIIMEVEKKPKSDYNDYKLVRAKDTSTPLANMEWLYQVGDLTEHIYQPTLQEVLDALQGKRIERGGGRAALVASSAPAPAALPAAPAPPPPPPTPVPPPAPVARTPIPVPAAPVPVAPAPSPAPAPPTQPLPTPPLPTPPPPPPAAAPAPPMVTAPAPPPPPAPAPRGRRARAPEPPAPTPPAAAPPAAPPLATAAAPAPPPVAAPSRRQPMAPATAAATDGDPYAAARAEINRMIDAGLVRPLDDGSRFVPHEPSPEEAADAPKIPCYLRETDPADKACQGCAALLVCLQGRMAGVAGSIAWTFPQRT